MIYQPMRIPPRDRGAALPAYQRRSAGHAPGSAVSARVDDSAGRIAGEAADAKARALAGLGRTLAGAARAVAENGARAYDDYSKSRATRLITQYRRDMNEALYGEDGILTRQGEAALDADGQRAARAERLRGELLRDADEGTRHYFTLLADDFDADSSLRARQHAGEQREVMLNLNDDEAARERAEWAMTSYARQPDFDRGLGEGLWHTRQLLLRKGCAGETLERGLREFSSGVFAGAISRALAGGDPASAERLLERGSAARGEGDAAWSLMSAPDIADARLRIQCAKEALTARAEAERKKAEAAAIRRNIQDGVRAILADVADFPTLEEQERAALARVEAMGDPVAREGVKERITREMRWRSTRRDAAVAREKRRFQEMARKRGWTPGQAADELERAQLSDGARDELLKDHDGRAGRRTPANRAALSELRALLDLGAERGGMDPGDADAIDAWIHRHGLTYDQALSAHEYAESGGMPGRVTQTRLNRAFGALFPGREKIPDDLADALVEELARLSPGKCPTDAEVKSVMARLCMEGESWRCDGEESPAAGAVPDADAARIGALLREAGVNPSPARVLRYYREEREGRA